MKRILPINLNDPELPKKLIKDARKRYPLRVFEAYVKAKAPQTAEASSQVEKLVDHWTHDETLKTKLDPQKAVNQARPALKRASLALKSLLDPDVWRLLAEERKTERLKDVYGAIEDARKLIEQARSRKVGKTPTTRFLAARAFIIRKFNPDVTWVEAWDLVRKEGKCDHCKKHKKHKDSDGCHVSMFKTVSGQLRKHLKSISPDLL